MKPFSGFNNMAGFGNIKFEEPAPPKSDRRAALQAALQQHFVELRQRKLQRGNSAPHTWLMGLHGGKQ